MKQIDDILLDYKTSKLALEIMQKEVDEKKAAVVEVLREMPNQKAKIGNTSFYLQSWTSYEYSEEVRAESEKLKALQKLEVETGKATIKSETFAPVMRVAKAKEIGGEE